MPRKYDFTSDIQLLKQVKRPFQIQGEVRWTLPDRNVAKSHCKVSQEELFQTSLKIIYHKIYFEMCDWIKLCEPLKTETEGKDCYS